MLQIYELSKNAGSCLRQAVGIQRGTHLDKRPQNAQKHKLAGQPKVLLASLKTKRPHSVPENQEAHSVLLEICQASTRTIAARAAVQVATHGHVLLSHSRSIAAVKAQRPQRGCRKLRDGNALISSAALPMYPRLRFV